MAEQSARPQHRPAWLGVRSHAEDDYTIDNSMASIYELSSIIIYYIEWPHNKKGAGVSDVFYETQEYLVHLEAEHGLDVVDLTRGHLPLVADDPWGCTMAVQMFNPWWTSWWWTIMLGLGLICLVLVFYLKYLWFSWMLQLSLHALRKSLKRKKDQELSQSLQWCIGSYLNSVTTCNMDQLQSIVTLKGFLPSWSCKCAGIKTNMA